MEVGRWRRDIISDSLCHQCHQHWAVPPHLDCIIRVSHPHSFWQLLLKHEAECLGRGNIPPDQPHIPILIVILESLLVRFVQHPVRITGIDQRSTNFQVANILSSAGHMVSGTTTQLCC